MTNAVKNAVSPGSAIDMLLKDKIDVVVGPDTELEVDAAGSLRIVQGQAKHTLPAEKIGAIVLEGNQYLPPKVMSLCEKYRINVSYVNGRGRYLATLCYEPAKNVHIRVKQYETHLDQKKSLFLAARFIQGKITNAFRLMEYKKEEYAEYIEKIENIESKETLLGIEGSAAKRYFNAFGAKINNKHFTWSGRSKRPPRDPVNALLSLGYTTLLYDIVSIINLCGLEPYIGYLHDNYYGRPSLACDFLEEFRAAYVDRFVLKVINCKEFNEDDFEDVLIGDKNAGVYLNKQGKAKFYPKWAAWYREEEVVSKRHNMTCDRRRLLEKQVRHLIHYLVGDEAEYQPFDYSNM